MSERVKLTEIEEKARELYEAARKQVSGRPRWENLDPGDPYDMGMRDLAFSEATAALSAQSDK